MVTDLSALIYPVSKADFYETYYEQDILFVRRGSHRKHNNLFSRADIETIWEHHGTHLDKFMRIATKGMIVLPRQTGDIRSAIDWMLKEYQLGATLILDDLKKYALPVTRLAVSLQREFGCDVDVSAFLTPSDSPGIQPHCDHMDVFILQIYGNKKWSIYGQAGPYFSLAPQSLVKPTHEFSLRPGDVLYMPRGFIHQGRTEDQPSLSLSIVLSNPLKWVDLLKRSLEVIAEEHPHLRHSIPLAQRDSISSAEVFQFFRNWENLMQQPALLNECLKRCKRETAAARSGAGLSLAGFVAAEETTIHDPVVRRTTLPCYLDLDTDECDSVAFYFPGSSLEELTAKVVPALQFIAASTSPFCAADLPGDFSNDTKLLLVRRLLREGLLAKAESSKDRANSCVHDLLHKGVTSQEAT